MSYAELRVERLSLLWPMGFASRKHLTFGGHDARGPWFYASHACAPHGAVATQVGSRAYVHAALFSSRSGAPIAQVGMI